MKRKLEQFETPFITQISFHKLIETLESIAESNVDYRVNYAKALLKEIAGLPEFRTGIQDLSLIDEHKDLIKNLLADLFPTALTHNEIKAVAIPFHNITFNYTQRFKKILGAAGFDFDMNIRDFEDDLFYIMNCCLILNDHYQQNIDFTNPLFYDIPDSNGIMKHYRILYNADFIEIIPTNKAIPLTQEDIDLLIENFDDIALWKEKFPLESWILKGFGIVQLYDATTESSVSTLKTNLLKATDTKDEDLQEDFQSIFRSIFKIPDLKVGLTIYDPEDKKFIRPNVDAKNIQSVILSETEEADCGKKLYDCFFNCVVKEKQTFIISNLNHFEQANINDAFAKHLRSQNIQSCILAPVVKNDEILGVFELSSEKPRALNSINANKLDLILPYLVDTLSRYRMDLQNQIEAIIQNEYTSIHSSVYWKFRKEAQKFLRTGQPKEHIFKEIVFKEVYPLFGEIDIKGSSEHRNQTVKQDLKKQLDTVIEIIESLISKANLIILEQRKFELESFRTELDLPLKADTEQIIQRYIESEIHPVIQNENAPEEIKTSIKKYFDKIDEKTGMFYQSRKKFDNALTKVNKKLASILDEKQLEAQQIFPHYYERFKSDGVEHNLYIGASIDPNKPFDKIYLNNLRLWQLQTLCEMELQHHEMKADLPYHLEVTSLILVFSSPISIRFRMDEKRFDVDGTYNARYEVVKKRIDKAFIKGTKERITEKEKITIVYSHANEKKEYMDYIKYLQFKEILEPNVEQFEVEELQGVSGLKGIRVKVAHQKATSVHS
ncbi:GAF domain-containing protein [Flavobacterium sp. UBA7682]|uniref:GAF domain-containing protein n=1 Tax=Flavobacterium sp. UBA7682 TaxID=1946560 RepID=UPI0025B83A97|nr:GAF domain-containing protein [Flavobacterium sp. UBA7682]